MTGQARLWLDGGSSPAVSLRRGRGSRFSRSLPVSGQQAGGVSQSNTRGKAGQHVAEVFDGVDLGQPATRQDRVRDGGALTTGV